MLSDVLAALVAFVSIVLLLSMIVTALVQTTQSILRLRARNLLKGVGTLLRNHDLTSASGRMDVRALASKVLNDDAVALIDKVPKPDTFTRHALLGPKVSWAEPAALAQAIRHVTKTEPVIKAPAPGEAAPATAAPAAAQPAVDELQREIEKMEPAWRKRFQYFVRIITIVWAVLVAGSFQVSAPALFSALSHDRALAAQVARNNAEIARLASRSGEPDASLNAAASKLDVFGIQFWKKGGAFYIDTSKDDWDWHWDAIIGVLLTSILLTFGAPFWFEQLRNLAALRDLREPPSLTPPKAPVRQGNSAQGATPP
ncbi:MAG: hypothetical protein ACREUC_09465 [Steroidobacteraceae bacterium]